MSNLTEKVHYDQRSDQIKIDGPVSIPTREFMQHLREEGLRKDSFQQVWAGGDASRGSGQQGQNPSDQGGERTGRTSG